MSWRGITLISGALATLACGELTTVRAPVGISVTAVELNLVPGEVQVLGARLVDARGVTVNETPQWTSSDPAIATIDRDAGVVTAIDLGTATLTGSFGTLHATTFVTVRPPNPPNTLSMSRPPAAVIAGGTDSLAAEAYDKSGRRIAAVIIWSSADPSVATIGQFDGVLAGIAAGTTTITATAGAISATVAMSVIELSGSLTFARWTPLGENLFTIDVLSFSAADRLMRPVERAGQLRSIAAPSWSPDGSALALEVIHGFHYDASHFWLDYASDVHVLDITASGASSWRTLTTDGLSKSPHWSPDGRRVAYLNQASLWAKTDVFIMEVATGVPVRVTKTDGWYGPPRWSPDGSRLTFSNYLETGSYLTNHDDIFIVNADGTGLRNATNNPGADYSPTWSPDGRQIAFASSRGSTANNPDAAVYVMDVEGLYSKRLTSSFFDLADVTWSPDGKQIAFSSGGSLYVMNADGSSPARLTRPAGQIRDHNPSWKR